ncbi:MAG TPA: response regulator [Candidatus Omnitrophota bacterium]|nr:response regulator [Candidatus Omnitrophota bacterium]HPN56134.1 response regulator [Candidatus Omnitrophota bacterium]
MKKILIIDDEEKIRAAYRNVLAQEGFEVVEARDAAHGISEILRNQDINLVLLDIKMPGMNGGNVKDLVGRFDLPLKFIVSSVYCVDDQRRYVPGADDYFDKVQGVDVLIEKVKRVLGCLT